MKKETRKKSPAPSKSRASASKPRQASSAASRVSFSDFDRRWKPWAIAAGGIAGIAITLWGVQATFVHLRLTEAEAQIKKNFTALASESLEPVRYELTSSVRGCQALVAAYFGAHKPERLEWAAQACITAGVETSDMYVGLAAARELVGQDGDALKILTQVAQKFDKSPDPLYRIAQIYRRNKKDAEATDLLVKAAELAPTNNQLSMETLEALSTANRWADARKYADRIKAVESDSPEVKLVIARALMIRPRRRFRRRLCPGHFKIGR
jgi:tetratricopeptide (TPR) repeat protein